MDLGRKLDHYEFNATGKPREEMPDLLQISIPVYFDLPETAMRGGIPYTVLRDTIWTHPTAAEGLLGLFARVPQRRHLSSVPEGEAPGGYGHCEGGGGVLPPRQ